MLIKPRLPSTFFHRYQRLVPGRPQQEIRLRCQNFWTRWFAGGLRRRHVQQCRWWRQDSVSS